MHYFVQNNALNFFADLVQIIIPNNATKQEQRVHIYSGLKFFGDLKRPPQLPYG